MSHVSAAYTRAFGFFQSKRDGRPFYLLLVGYFGPLVVCASSISYTPYYFFSPPYYNYENTTYLTLHVSLSCITQLFHMHE
jgi:hypothetical protein